MESLIASLYHSLGLVNSSIHIADLIQLGLRRLFCLNCGDHATRRFIGACVDQGGWFKVAPYSKLAVRSLSTSMARALKTARRPHKNKTNTASQFQDISPEKLY